MYQTKPKVIHLILAISLGFPLLGIAENEQGRSIMFQPKEDMQTADQLGSSHTPLQSLQQSDDHCARLLKKIDQLKGKPQQRHAARLRFDQECRSEAD